MSPSSCSLYRSFFSCISLGLDGSVSSWSIYSRRRMSRRMMKTRWGSWTGFDLFVYFLESSVYVSSVSPYSLGCQNEPTSCSSGTCRSDLSRSMSRSWSSILLTIFPLRIPPSYFGHSFSSTFPHVVETSSGCGVSDPASFGGWNCHGIVFSWI